LRKPERSTVREAQPTKAAAISTHSATSLMTCPFRAAGRYLV
jgi:hypothetical protein